MYSEGLIKDLLKNLSDTAKELAVGGGHSLKRDVALLSKAEAILHEVMFQNGRRYGTLKNGLDVWYGFAEKGELYVVSTPALKSVMPEEEYAAFTERVSADGIGLSGIPFETRHSVSWEKQDEIPGILSVEEAPVEEHSPEPKDEPVEEPVPNCIGDRLHSSAFRERMHEIAEILRKGTRLHERLKDVTSIRRDELLQFYSAFKLNMGDQVGRFEYMTAPLDPASPTGRFAYWVYKYDSEKAYVNVSSENDGREEGNYRFYSMRDDLSVTFKPVMKDGKYTVDLELSDDSSADISVKKSVPLGNRGHIVFVDEENETAIHVFPLEMRNNSEGNAGAFYAVEHFGECRAGILPYGTGTVTTVDGDHTLTVRWKDDVLYAHLT